MRQLIIAFLAAALAGCMATGPISSPEFPTLIANAIPPEAGQVVLDAPATWYPNTIGFADLRNNVFGPMTFITGVVIVGTAAVVFAQFDDANNRYNVMREIRYSDLVDARIDTMGKGSRLVLQRKDYSYDTFELALVGGTFIDVPKTHAAAEYLRAQIGRKNR